MTCLLPKTKTNNYSPAIKAKTYAISRYAAQLPRPPLSVGSFSSPKQQEQQPSTKPTNCSTRISSTKHVSPTPPIHLKSFGNSVNVPFTMIHEKN